MIANRYIGSPVERFEDRRFLRGKGTYVGDLSRPGLLYAAILRSPRAHGRIRSIDATAALALRGAHTIITAAQIGSQVPRIPIRLQPLPVLVPYHQPVIAERKVRYVGEPIAVVLADSAAIAEDALDLIRVDIEQLPPVPDRHAAAKAEALLFEETGTNLAIRYIAAKGDPGRVWARADYVRRERFAVQRHTAVMLEPRGVLAEWDAAHGRLTVSGASKVAFFNRRILAEQMGLAEDAIDMVENDVGGGFGVRGEFYPEDFLIPFAARFTGRPVKWIEDRREHLIAANHAREAECELKIACRYDGTIVALQGDVYVDVGAYNRTNGMVGARNIAQFLSGPYRIPDIRIEASLLLTNKTPVGTYRGPGRFEADFFRERLFDIVARDLGIDPVEFRRRNLLTAAEMPYSIATITPYEHKDAFDSGDYRLTLDRCLQEIDWAEKSKLQGKLVDGRYQGLGIGCFIEGSAAGPRENARIELESDGTVSIFVGSSAVGQGLETAFAQIAADALEIPIDRIRGVFHGSTAFVREGFGSFHSRAVVMGGSAILLAAESFKQAVRTAAARQLGCEPGAVRLVEGRLAATPDGKSVSFAELAGGGISAEESFANSRHAYSYGAHAAHVAVDPRTGGVEVVDYVAVEDVGRIINPMLLKGQMVGAVVQGLGGALLEHLVYDDEGQLMTGSLADYLLPTASDFPSIRAVVTETHPSPINPLGAKGAGEGGVVPVGGVIANAVASALAPLNVQPHELPLSPSRIWHLIETAHEMQQQLRE
ncbi:MAG: xanthine dehydrogenase family protein molybdopterin-binding subunit [Alphaproteobacteria bacterium]|nr:xanthine dehydrogenase family protein molybdopterin-binding subunit [Alphaproteobacteria bacterium]